MGCVGKFAFALSSWPGSANPCAHTLSRSGLPAERGRRFLKLVALHLTRAESMQTAEAVPRQAMPLATSAIKPRLAELWPHAMVWLGIVLTIAWCGSLAWAAV